MVQSRRESLKGAQDRCEHAGLWFDCFLETQARDDVEARRRHVESVIAISEPRIYEAFFRRWVKQLEEMGALTSKASVMGRMIVGLGSESPIETGITLHKTYGVPYIPGSAIKGLLSSFTRREVIGWESGSPAARYVFGETEEAGAIHFFDALYIPKSGKDGKPLAADVMTPHHSDYYGGGAKPPADWDSPTPVPFLCATGEYLIAIQGEASWVGSLFEILKYALLEYGIGGKTAAGYGRLALNFTPPAKNTLSEVIVSRYDFQKNADSTLILETEEGEKTFIFKKKDRNKIFSERFLALEKKEGQSVIAQWRERTEEKDGKNEKKLIIESVALPEEK